MTPSTPCGECPALSGCLYPQFFEDEARSVDARHQAPPRPFVLQLEPRNSSEESPPDTVVFTMTLLGETARYVSTLIPAFRQAGRRGIQLARRRVTLDLEGVDQESPLLSGNWGFLATKPGVAGVEDISLPVAPESVRIRFVTPVRLKLEGRPVAPHRFSAGLFMDRLSDRFNLVQQFYGDPPTAADCTPADEQFHLVRSHLRWQAFHHHTSRKDIQLGGLMGTVDLAGGSLARIWPMLWLGQVLGVGNHTAMGFGQYCLEPWHTDQHRRVQGSGVAGS